ncbi:protein tyrosine phosphatase [Asticcacaulis sp. AC460]|uniref:low molecular weight protein-tyrosine-phosphatase n=1 Tax=Asticcacaulis sp. AC460 TaxID=1282360 RepID=UPI0003C40115|nr:low molecular weight protein-tyrosine-phosphatase [Asticcacaulis sp. AC460]ESQ90354.1 protein tyrosine phosphatase [Asticcacaulis sp. AC460]
MTAILFVCLGNICRSPLAEGVLRHKVREKRLDHRFDIDSAGCGGWHAGEAPDHRSIAVAARFGMDISGQSARQVKPHDFDHYDLILGLDRDNVRHLTQMQPPGSKAKVALYLEEALGLNKDVPDPYYGGARDFEAVYRLCDQASDALLAKLV